MSTVEMIDLLFVAVVFGMVAYWILIAPGRARRKRRQDLYGQTGHLQAWDPDIGARKRER